MSAGVVTSAFLTKASKHMALLVCFLILGLASRRTEVSQFFILGLAVTSALLHLAGRSFQQRLRRESLLRRELK